MERDPEMGTVIVLAGEGHASVYDNQPGISFDLAAERMIQLSPLDGPIRLEGWGAGGGVAYDGTLGDNPDADPTAQPTSDGGTHLYGVMPDGRKVFTAPLMQIERWVPNGTPFATVVDGLVFELGEPDPEWMAFCGSDAADVLNTFIQSFSPLDLLPTSAYPRTVQ